MLATVGIVDCIFHRVASAHPVSILGNGERLLRFRLNGTECHRFFDSYCIFLLEMVDLQSEA